MSGSIYSHVLLNHKEGPKIERLALCSSHTILLIRLVDNPTKFSSLAFYLSLKLDLLNHLVVSKRRYGPSIHSQCTSGRLLPSWDSNTCDKSLRRKVYSVQPHHWHTCPSRCKWSCSAGGKGYLFCRIAGSGATTWQGMNHMCHLHFLNFLTLKAEQQGRARSESNLDESKRTWKGPPIRLGRRPSEQSISPKRIGSVRPPSLGSLNSLRKGSVDAGDEVSCFPKRMALLAYMHGISFGVWLILYANH